MKSPKTLLIVIIALIYAGLGCSEKGDPAPTPQVTKSAVIDLAKTYDDKGLTSHVETLLKSLNGSQLLDIVELKPTCGGHENIYGLTTAGTSQKIVPRNSTNEALYKIRTGVRPFNIHNTFSGQSYTHIEYVEQISICIKNTIPFPLMASSLMHELSHALDTLGDKRNSLKNDFQPELIEDMKEEYFSEELRARNHHSTWLKNYVKKSGHKPTHQEVKDALASDNDTALRKDIKNAHYDDHFMIYAGQFFQNAYESLQVLQSELQKANQHQDLRTIQAKLADLNELKSYDFNE